MHYLRLFLDNGESIEASEVTKGMSLSADNGKAIVLDVRPTTAQGFYAPVTASGTVKVNGIQIPVLKLIKDLDEGDELMTAAREKAEYDRDDDDVEPPKKKTKGDGAGGRGRGRGRK